MRIAIVGAVALVLSVTSAHAQGQPKKEVVFSKSILKSMVANKSKTKTALGSQAGIGRKSSVVVKQSIQAPTSVRAIGPLTKKK